MKKIQLLIITLVALSISLNAQEDNAYSKTKIGIFGDVNLNSHTVNFRSLPQTPCCGDNFLTGKGIGPSLGVLFAFPVYDRLSLELRLGYHSQDGLFTKDEAQIVNLNGDAVAGKFEQSIDAKLRSIALDPIFGYNVWQGLYLHLGFHAGYAVTQTYTQEEKILEPATGNFENGLRTRMKYSGDIPNAVALETSVLAGVSYEIPLNMRKTWFLSPEAFYVIGLQNIVKDLPWKMNSLRLGLALKYAPSKTHSTKDYIIDTLQVRSNKYTLPTIVEGNEFYSERTETTPTNEKILVKEIRRVDTLFTPALMAKLSTTAIAENGTRGKVSDIHVSTQFVTEVFPVLPYVFFEKKSSQVPSRYETVNNPSEFSVENLEPNPVTIQRNVLNIIGKRMLNNPATTIALLGASDPTSENSDCNLASTRAQVLRNYLVKTWGIAEDRIALKPLKDPCNPSAITQTQIEAGYGDNRRVEISTNDPELLSSIQGKRYNEPYKVTPPIIEHDPAGSSTDGVVNWMLVGSQGSKKIFSMSGDGPPVKIENKISNQTAMELRADMPLQLTYILKDKEGITATATEEFNVTKDTSEIEIKRLSLTVFNVGSADVTKSASDEIKKFIQNLEPESQINIIGYTDKLGDDNFNMNLSKNRANSIKDHLQKLSPSAKITSTTGVAFTSFPPGIYSYNSPEERFLSRTVQIEVRHKIKK